MQGKDKDDDFVQSAQQTVAPAGPLRICARLRIRSLQ